METAFHKQLRLLAGEYDLVRSENSHLRKKLGLSEEQPPPHTWDLIEPISAQLNGKLGENGSAYVTSLPAKPNSDFRDVHALLKDPIPKLPGAVDAMYDETDFEVSEKVREISTPSPRGDITSMDTLSSAPFQRRSSRKGSKQSNEQRNEEKNEHNLNPKIVEPIEDDDDEEVDAAKMKLLLLLDVIPAGVIMLNAVVQGIEADDKGRTAGVFEVLEIAFFVFYTLEIMVKCKVFGPRVFFLGKDWAWSWFDFACVSASALELGIKYSGATGDGGDGGGGGGVFQMMKMLKLARLGRIVRVLKFKIFLELKLMIQGVVTGMRVLGWAVVLLILLTYIIGIGLNMIFEEAYPEFSTVDSAMLTLFRCFTDGCATYGGAPLQEHIRQDLVRNMGLLWMCGYILVYLFVTIGVFNLIMAVFIDNVNDGSVKKKQYNLGLTSDKTEMTLAEKIQALCDQTFHNIAERPTIRQRMSQAMVDKMTDLESKVTGKKPHTAKEFEERAKGIKYEMMQKGCLVSKEVFNSWLTNKKTQFLDLLEEAEIDVSMKFELFDVLDTDLSGELEFAEIVEGLMKCRGPVSKTDIIGMGLKVRYCTKLIQDIWEKVVAPDLEKHT
mmetsp:Transcript_23244/g.41981  ORF Transcript_23244/g.41981 Transcript_23244/m.41981 type:complete len:610 (-) Transcript_23244:38-1867(-)